MPATQSVGPRVQIDSTMRRAQSVDMYALCCRLGPVVLSQLKVYSQIERDIPHPMIAQGTLVTACLISVLPLAGRFTTNSAAVPASSMHYVRVW